MAIYHMSIKIGSKSKGQSAVAASAYRSGDKLTDKETGLTSDYTRKSGIVFSEISLCKNAPIKYTDRATLWNAVHQIEKNKNAQLWREFEVALPRELNREKQIDTIRDFVKQLTNKGMCVDWSLHDKGDGNPHAHIMTTMRSITNDGKWAVKSRLVYDLDENGERIFQKVNNQGRKQYKSHKEDYNDWNKKERIEEWRVAWSECCNIRLAEHDRIDHRSYVRQGIEQEPTIHEGYIARKLKERAGTSDRCQINQEIIKLNGIKAEIEKICQQEKELQKKIAEVPVIPHDIQQILDNIDLCRENKRKAKQNLDKCSLFQFKKKSEYNKIIDENTQKLKRNMKKLEEIGIENPNSKSSDKLRKQVEDIYKEKNISLLPEQSPTKEKARFSLSDLRSPKYAPRSSQRDYPSKRNDLER